MIGRVDIKLSLEPLPSMLFILHCPCLSLFRPTINNQHQKEGRGKMKTDSTGTLGSTAPLCCNLPNRSLKRFPSTFNARKLSLRSSPSCTSTRSSGTRCFPSLVPARPERWRRWRAAARLAARSWVRRRACLVWSLRRWVDSGMEDKRRFVSAVWVRVRFCCGKLVFSKWKILIFIPRRGDEQPCSAVLSFFVVAFF